MACSSPRVFKALQDARLNPRRTIDLPAVMSIVGATLAEDNERLQTELLDLYMLHGPSFIPKQ